MVAKILEKVLVAVIRKERAISVAFSFLIGAASTAVGTNVDLVYQELCGGRDHAQEQVQES